MALRKILLLMFVSLILAACSASGPRINTDYDQTVDFSQYKTYNFFNPMGIESRGYSTIFGSVFRQALSREMESRGYTLSDSPDLVLNVSARLQEKTKVTQTTDPYPYAGGYYGYRRGAYTAWGGYGYNTSTHVSQYTEGTINVDMVDINNKRMVWEGVAIGRLKENRTNEEVRVKINEGVTEMFAGYPFRAGQ